MFYLLCEWQKLYEAYYKLISGLHKFCKRFCYYARAKIYAHPCISLLPRNSITWNYIDHIDKLHVGDNVDMDAAFCRYKRFYNPRKSLQEILTERSKACHLIHRSFFSPSPHQLSAFLH